MVFTVPLELSPSKHVSRKEAAFDPITEKRNYKSMTSKSEQTTRNE